MVQLFYFNGDLYHTGKERERAENGLYVLPHIDFYTHFNRKQISINEDRIRNALGIPSCLNSLEHIPSTFDYVAACKVIFL